MFGASPPRRAAPGYSRCTDASPAAALQAVAAHDALRSSFQRSFGARGQSGGRAGRVPPERRRRRRESNGQIHAAVAERRQGREQRARRASVATTGPSPPQGSPGKHGGRPRGRRASTGDTARTKRPANVPGFLPADLEALRRDAPTAAGAARPAKTSSGQLLAAAVEAHISPPGRPDHSHANPEPALGGTAPLCTRRRRGACSALLEAVALLMNIVLTDSEWVVTPDAADHPLGWVRPSSRPLPRYSRYFHS